MPQNTPRSPSGELVDKSVLTIGMSHSKMIQVRVKYDVVERKNLRRIASVKTETIDLHEAKIVAENEAPFALEFTLQNKVEKLRAWQGKLYRCAARNLDLSTGIIEIRTVFRDRLAAVSMTWLEPDTIIINDRAWVPATLPHLQVNVRRHATPQADARVSLETTYAFNTGDRGNFSIRDYDAALAHAHAVADMSNLPLCVCDAPQLLIPELVPHDERIPDRARLQLEALIALREARRLIDDSTTALLQGTTDVLQACTLAEQAATATATERALVPLHTLNPSVS
jgi:hypothetical protein